MKTLAALLLLTLSSQAYAEILSITRDSEHPDRVLFVADVKICKNSFPTLSATAEKLADGKAILNVKTFPGACENPENHARFYIDAEYQLKKIGIDAKTASIYVQMQ
jgi:hypothetical protein